MNTFPKRYLQSCMAAGSLLLSAAALHSEVALTFDNDMDGFQSLTWAATDTVWSPNYGGSMAITVSGNWQWAAQLSSTGGLFFDEMTLAMTNGGTLTFDVIVDAAGLPAGNFQLGVSAQGNDTGWNEVTLFSATSADVAGGPVTFPVSIPIRPSDNPGDVGGLVFSPAETRFDFTLGQRDGNAGSTTVYVDNFTITAGSEVLEPPPEPPTGNTSVLFESFETAVPVVFETPPYTAITQSTEAGVTEGAYSMKVEVDNSMTWSWITIRKDAEAYDNFKANGRLIFDLSRTVMDIGANLEVVLVMVGDGADWTQQQLLNWQWFNAGTDYSDTFVYDYTAMRDAAASTGEWFEVGLMFRTSGGAEVFVDNIRFEGDPPPPPGPYDPQVATYDLGRDGWNRAFGDEVAGTSVEHSADFGGSIQLVKGDNGALQYEKIAESNFGLAHALSAAMQEAGVLGGTLELDVIFPAGSIGFDAGSGVDIWFTFKNAEIAVGEFDAWGDQRVILNAFGPGETPDNEERRFTISIPIVPGIDPISYADPALPLVSALKLAANHDRYFIEIGATQGNVGALTFHLDNLTIIPAAPGAAIVFDQDTEDFASTGSGTVSHDAALGGSLQIELAATAGSQTADVADAMLSHGFRQGLARSVRADGLVSFDLVADTGVLAGMQPRVSLVSATGSTVTSIGGVISAEAVTDLGDGKETVRIFLSVSEFGASTEEVYTGLRLGFTYNSSSPVTVHLDNVMIEVVFSDTTTTVLDFADGFEGFEATGATAVFNDGRTDDVSNKALLVVGPTGWVWQTEATFTGGDISTGLAQAAAAGGTLAFDVVFDDFSARNTTAEFAGATVLVAVDSGEWRQQEIAFADVALPLSSGQFAVRTVEIPLYPSGSTETDGLVIEPNTSYVIAFGSNSVEGSASSIEFFIDNVAVTSATLVHPPILLAAPQLDLMGGLVFGRVLVAFGDGATYSASGLPAGMSIDPATGALSGAPTENGTFDVTVSVTTDAGTVEETYQWEVTGAGTLDLVIVSYDHTNGQFTIHWSGNEGAAVNVEHSTDLEDWAPAATGETGTSWTDLETPTGKAFYRIVLP